MIRLLLITSHFPPEISGGVGRPNSLYLHLPDHDIDVDVLTISHSDSKYQSGKVYRTPSLNPSDPDFDQFSFWFFRVFNKILKIFGGHNTLDSRWLWHSLQLLKKDYFTRPYDCIYVTFPSINPLIIALYLKYKYGIPFVAEFRDGLTFEPLVRMNRLQIFVARLIERKVVSNANSVITVGHVISADLSSKYTKAISTVHNGFNSSTVASSESDRETDANKNNKKITFVHLGNLTFSKPRDVRVLFEGIRFFINKCHAIECIQFIFYGRFSKHEYELLEEYDLDGIVSFMPAAQPSEMAKIGKGADFLLFYGVPGDRGFISAKLMEYLSYSRPILGICSGNEAETIIESTGVGLVSDFDSNEIADCLERLVQTRGQYILDPSKILLYSREAQAAEISKIIFQSLSVANRKVA